MILKNKISFIFLLVLGFNSCKQDNIGYYEDPLGAFAVAHFKEPMVSLDTLNSSVGNIYYHSFLVQESASSAKLVSYSDYPIASEDIKQGKAVLQSAKESALNSLGIKNILKEVKIESKEYFGVEIVGTNNEMYFMHYKLLLKGNRLYQIGLLKENSIEESAEESDFINSFQILH